MTTSPSFLHLGHWKTLTAGHSFSHDKTLPEYIELDSMQQDIRSACPQLINYALRWGFSDARWQYMYTVMILKDASVNKIHRPRVNHIYEADYNLTLVGIKWRALMHHAAVDNGRCNNGQYSCHNRSPITTCH
jgi:hypothetical protein